MSKKLLIIVAALLVFISSGVSGQAIEVLKKQEYTWAAGDSFKYIIVNTSDVLFRGNASDTVVVVNLKMDTVGCQGVYPAVACSVTARMYATYFTPDWIDTLNLTPGSAPMAAFKAMTDSILPTPVVGDPQWNQLGVPWHLPARSLIFKLAKNCPSAMTGTLIDFEVLGIVNDTK